MTLEAWLASGERIPVDVTGSDGNNHTFRIFVRTAGRGPCITFLHGFPTCSWDWAGIESALAEKFCVIFLDFLGFGDSDKRAGFDYSIALQADIVSAVWAHLDIASTYLVAHDYGDTVACELLARFNEGTLAVDLPQVVLLNGGIYIDKVRALRIQKLLRHPLLGPIVSLLMNEQIFRGRFSSIFSPHRIPEQDDLRQHWQAIVRRGGKRNYHRLGRYLDERRQFKARWEGVLKKESPRVRYLWGQWDPISGKSVSDEVRRRTPESEILELDDVGHYPQIEVPEVVAKQLQRWLA